MSNDADEIEQKEDHRLGTIGKWDPPEADWAAEYDWTRYRGPAAWPVPGGWTFGDPEGGGWWRYFGDAGVGHPDDNSILDELEADDSIDEPHDRRSELHEQHGEYASLTAETANPDEVSMLNPDDEKLEWTLDVDGEQVFRRVEPDRSDLMAAVAEALDAYHNDEKDRFEEIVPETGRKPDDVLEREKQERREEENESLDEFATDGGWVEHEPDHYDLLLRSMQKGLLIGVNNARGVSATPLDEATVVYSTDQETEVMARRGHDDHVWITRDRNGDLVLREEDGHDSRYVDDVVSIEIVGMESSLDPDDREPRPISPSIPQRDRFEAIKAEWSEAGTPELTDRQVLDGLLDTKEAAAEGHYAEAAPHEFEVGDVLEKEVDGAEWKITHCLIDADTGDLLYRLQDTDDFTEMCTEQQLQDRFDVEAAREGGNDE